MRTDTTTPDRRQGPVQPRLIPTPAVSTDRHRVPGALLVRRGSASDERPRRPRPGLSDQLAAGALLHALEPGWSPEGGAAALARLAGDDQFALRRALARIRFRSLDRTTPVAERAATALRLALGSSPAQPPRDPHSGGAPARHRDGHRLGLPALRGDDGSG